MRGVEQEQVADISEKKYNHKEFFEQFGNRLKLGVHEDSTNRTKEAELMRYEEKCLEMFAEISEKNDYYKEFFEQFYNCLKLGVHEDSTNHTKVAELMRHHRNRPLPGSFV